MRRQATLFLRAASPIEDIRREFNPIQAKLIAAHVTLVREDEVSDWDHFGSRIASLGLEPVTLRFGPPQREGDLVLMRCIDQRPFDALRARILDSPRTHGAHVTLVHPRNGVCSDSDFAEIRKRIGTIECRFDELSVIKQIDREPWETIRRYRMEGVDQC